MEERYESELAQSTRVLDDVDSALARLSDGSYGSCARCGVPILDVDLAVDPTRRVCGEHGDGDSHADSDSHSDSA
jgi:RNA polymerase-binding transcription factor DksA